ncbi:MAG: DUF192 domain-containing protein [Alphaproteobacteria bacterium]|nr:DUF192 domain-containing protein [Alphaproteobacteria bacterium]
MKAAKISFLAKYAHKVVFLLSLFTFANVSVAQDVQFSWEQIVIETGKGERIYDVEMATSYAQRQRGLMYREHLEQNKGMLFDYGEPYIASMWMKNTLIPLDMLFVSENGVIAHIHHRAKPHDLTPISADKPVRAVIELKGGIAKMHFIKPGDKVIHPIFANQP